MEIVSLILAAGKGTRMKSELPKVLHKVNGVSMVQKVINTLKDAEINNNILILGHKKELVLESVTEKKYVVQEEQLGTGHAVMQASEELKDFDGIALILCGDTPLLRASTINGLISYHKESGAVATILTTDFSNPFGYGRILKDESGEVKGIVEEKEASVEQKMIKEVNTGVYCFDSKKLFEALDSITNNNEKGEYYLTDVIEILEKREDKVEAYKIEDSREVLGVNSRVELEEANGILRARKNRELMESGVTIIDSLATYIEDEVEVGVDSTIYPGVTLCGTTTIGEATVIKGNCKIEDSKIGNSVVIESSVIEESIVGDRVTIGPFAHLRPKAILEDEVHIGNYVEVKKSILHKGVKAGHLTYIGDSEVGERTNFGAGTITCNYDGENKHKTLIGKDVFIGSNTKFVAPVEIGDNVLIGAGTVVTKDVPSNALAVGRVKPLIKNNWNKK